jgi:hypothetical protein
MGYSGYMLGVYEARYGASAMAVASMTISHLGAMFPLFTVQSKNPFFYECQAF